MLADTLKVDPRIKLNKAEVPGTFALMIKSLKIHPRIVLLVTLLCLSANPIAGQNENWPIPQRILLKIVQAEDERRWDKDLKELLSNANRDIRGRTVFAVGRIGDEAAVPSLLELLSGDKEASVRYAVLFALGEIESAQAADALRLALKNSSDKIFRAYAVEALGKIASALGTDKQKQTGELNAAILDVLKSEASLGKEADSRTVLLGLTAAIRSRLTDAGPTIAQFLNSPNPRIRADAANALARLRLKDGGPKLKQLLDDEDPIVRANAARALGAAENKEALDSLLGHALNDTDLRVRVSAIRALAALKDTQAAQSLLKRGASLSGRRLQTRPTEANEILEIVTTLGRLLQSSNNQEAVTWLKQVRLGFSGQAPEVEIAFARISPSAYLQLIGWETTVYTKGGQSNLGQWRARSSVAQALTEIANSPTTLPNRAALHMQGESLIEKLLATNDRQVLAGTAPPNSAFSIPEILRSSAAFKKEKIADVLRKHLTFKDVIVRGTAADLLGDLPPDRTNEQALIEALPQALTDELNDAALSILDSLGKQKTPTANEAIKQSLESSDYLIRRRAVALLKANGAGDFSSRIGTVKTRNTVRDYKRAVSRFKAIWATVRTSKGTFVIELKQDEAPLTVDNFVRLAQKGYFNGQTIPRVVPNFVVQAGDPRGDQNGGPGYAIRCEINDYHYDRGSVGMALSGKDTGGSQWFVTHSPQPHLDGGYTIFGEVVSGMEVVDRLVRGDKLLSVKIAEGQPPREISRNQTP